MALSNSPSSNSTRVEDFKALTRDGVSNREVPKIEEFAGQIGNYTIEERQELLETTRLALLHRQTQRDAKTALTSFRETMLQYSGLEALDTGNTSRATVVPETGDNVNTWKIDPALRDKANGIIESHTESPLTGSSLNGINITPTEAITIAISIPELGETLTHKKIKEYQKNHNIEDDGIIGKETYGEMFAGIVHQALIEVDENGIGADALEEISKLLEYATPEGNNVVLLRARLETFRQEHKDDADFNERYGDFFGTHTQREEEYIASPEGQAERERVERELSQTDADGRSMYRRIKDGLDNGNIGEELSSLMEDKGPMVLVLLAGAFIFGMIPGVNDSVATNSWWKRLLLAGIGLANGGSIKDIISDVAGGVSNFVRSPTAQNAFDSGKNAFSDFFKNTLPDFFNNSSEEILEAYESFTSRSETQNETHKDTDKYITNITEKGAVLLSDATFLNTSKEQLIEAQRTGSITTLISDEANTKLQELGMTTGDIKNYLELYVLPHFGEGHTLFRDTFLPVRARDAADEVLLNLSGSYIDNTKLNQIISDDINNLRLVGSDAQKMAATKLALAIQSLDINTFDGNISDFNIDEYPALSVNEKTQFENLIKKTIAIFTIESYIQKQINRIEEIEIVQGSETTHTIETRIQELENIYTSFAIDPTLLQAAGINNPDSKIEESDFSKENFTSQYTSKRSELFAQATALELTSVTLANGTVINITNEVAATKERETQEAAKENLQQIISALGEVPENTATPIEFRRYYEAHTGNFTALETIITTHESAADGTPEAILRDNAKVALKLRDDLKTNYLASRARYETKISTLNSQVNQITTNNVSNENYQTIKLQLQTIAGEFEQINSEIFEGITARDTIAALKAYVADDFILEAEKNAITFLDGIYDNSPDALTPLDLNTLPTNIKDTLLEVESGVNVNVDISDLDINDSNALIEIVNELKNKKTIVDSFENESVQTGKYRIIAEVFSEIQIKFKKEIEANIRNPVKAEQIISRYRNHVAPSISESFWTTLVWERITGIFRENDIVEGAYDAFEIQAGKDIFLELEMGNPRLAEVEAILIEFLINNQDVPLINDFRLRMEAKFSQNETIKFRVIYNKLTLWARDHTITGNKRTEIATLLTSIDSIITN